MKTLNPDVVFMTGWPFYQMLLAERIRRVFRVPVLLDFQDPWVSLNGSEKIGSKAWLAHRLAVALEPKVIRHASFITSVSDRQNDAMAERYPWLDRTRMAGIPIGGDPRDFDAARRSAHQRKSPEQQEAFTLSYVGTALPRSGPLFRAFFKGLAVFRRENPQVAARLLVRCVGTSNQANDATTFRVKPIAGDEGVGALVVEEPARVPFLDALGILSSTFAVLMVGSDEPHYTASKIYPGMMSGRPFLSVFHRASSAHMILSKAGGGIALAFETREELDALPTQIADALVQLTNYPESLGRVDPSAYAGFTARATAERFATIFNQLRLERLSQTGRAG